MNFTEFSLHPELLAGLNNAGYVACTDVQQQVLENSLTGRDLYVQSQTGTGKTAAYLVSIIQELLARTDVAGKKALILVPTRELAVQVQEEAEKLCSGSALKCGSFYGGVGYDKQVAILKNGVDIMIGTPGRVIDLQVGNQMKMDDVAFLVVDEADRMFDMGFYPDLRTLIKVLPSSEKRQTMLFSATLNSYVKNLAWEYTRDPAEITIAADNITVDEIDQILYHVSSSDKTKLLVGLINRDKSESLIIFCNTKKTCEIISKRLSLNGIVSEYIIGDLPQKKRLAIMDKFKSGAIKCLVATDVAARGIDVNDLAMVINYDLPNEAENYVHRIGRTARAGKSGKAYTFCSEQDVYSLPAIERYIEKQIPASVADESLFAQDKSEGVYIKLDSYKNDYNDKSEYGRKKQREFENRNVNRSGSSKGKGGNRGNGRYSEKNNKAKSEYKRDRRVLTAEEETMLSTMSSEERMKLYRERFAGKQNTSAINGTSVSKNSNSRNSSKNGNKNAGKNGGKNKYKNGSNYNGKKTTKQQNVKTTSSAAKKPETKKGFFGKLKSLFGMR